MPVRPVLLRSVTAMVHFQRKRIGPAHVREERHEHCEVYGVSRGLNLFAVYVDVIAEAQKGIERDSDRADHSEMKVPRR